MSSATTQRPNAAYKPPVKRVRRRLPLLESGDALDAEEFLRRYEAMPEIKKAELIDGMVYIMASPVRADQHGEPDSLMQACLGLYAFSTPGVRVASNSTTVLGSEDAPQPDISLRYLPERNGNVQVNKKGYLISGPELIVEIVASTASIDLHKKREAYQRAGVREYIAWCTDVSEFNWRQLVDGGYKSLPVDKDGVIRSRAFPGLWLDPKALLLDDRGRVKEVLELGLKSKEHADFSKSKTA